MTMCAAERTALGETEKVSTSEWINNFCFSGSAQYITCSLFFQIQVNRGADKEESFRGRHHSIDVIIIFKLTDAVNGNTVLSITIAIPIPAFCHSQSKEIG